MKDIIKEILTCQRCELCLEHTKRLEEEDKLFTVQCSKCLSILGISTNNLQEENIHCLECAKKKMKTETCREANQGDKVIFLKNSDLINIAKKIDNSHHNIRQNKDISEEETKYQKTLEKGINLLKNNPNAIVDILQVATRLSYLRGRLFEQTQQCLKGEKLVEAKATQTTETPNKDSADNTRTTPAENNQGCGKTFTYLKNKNGKITMECGTSNKGIVYLCDKCSDNINKINRIKDD